MNIRSRLRPLAAVLLCLSAVTFNARSAELMDESESLGHWLTNCFRGPLVCFRNLADAAERRFLTDQLEALKQPLARLAEDKDLLTAQLDRTPPDPERVKALAEQIQRAVEPLREKLLEVSSFMRELDQQRHRETQRQLSGAVGSRKIFLEDLIRDLKDNKLDHVAEMRRKSDDAAKSLWGAHKELVNLVDSMKLQGSKPTR
jgi:hypothetical protein